jgi:medium-chain acyl-[acyl-carrier-protein] hydrolase
MSTEWVTCFGPRPGAARRLLCLPYAGVGASAFRTWHEGVPEDVEVGAVQLPGRETRLEERPFTDMAALVDALLRGLGPLLDKPFALFGHSMGALVAFELARRLRQELRVSPTHLLVSGRAAPQLAVREAPIARLPDREFVDVLTRRYNGIPAQILESPELLAHFLPVLRADIGIIESYAYVGGTPLDCRIHVCGGSDDARVPAVALDAWRAQTTAAFTRETLPGDHFFIASQRSLMLHWLRRALALSVP